QARAVVARDDGSARDFEALPRRAEMLFGTDSRAEYREGPIALEVDLLADHKTGGYLDQVENHLRAGELAHGEALDAFCYHGGFLVTCSCSGRVTPELFGEVVAWASQEAKRPLQLLERKGAGRDHPPLVGVPETEYLKAWFLLAP